MSKIELEKLRLKRHEQYIELDKNNLSEYILRLCDACVDLQSRVRLLESLIEIKKEI